MFRAPYWQACVRNAPTQKQRSRGRQALFVVNLPARRMVKSRRQCCSTSARGEPQYLDRLLHAAHPAGGLDPKMGKLLLEGTSARLGLALTGYEHGAPAHW